MRLTSVSAGAGSARDVAYFVWADDFQLREFSSLDLGLSVLSLVICVCEQLAASQCVYFGIIHTLRKVVW
jgi:hypothetical protein